MAKVVYEVVEHNGGFAYHLGDAFSETFATHKAAHDAAEDAALRQQLAGQDEQIEYQDAKGRWHEEYARGDRRPSAEVSDRLPDDKEALDVHGEILEEDEVPNPDRAPTPDLTNRNRR